MAAACLMVNLQSVAMVDGCQSHWMVVDPAPCNRDKGLRQLRKAVVRSFESIRTSLSGFLVRCQTGLHSEKGVGFLLAPAFPFTLVSTA